MRRATNAAANTINILIALRAMLGKIDARAEHAANVGVTLVETTLHNRIDERTAVEEHALVRLQVVFFGNFLASMCVTFPQFTILYLLHL